MPVGEDVATLMVLVTRIVGISPISIMVSVAVSVAVTASVLDSLDQYNHSVQGVSKDLHSRGRRREGSICYRCRQRRIC